MRWPTSPAIRTPTSWVERDPIVDDETDVVDVLFIGGGFSALLTSARLREKGVESIRIVERGADVGGTWYWNRYPGVACDVVAYDYLPLLDEMNYVPTRHYAEGPEIFAHCQAIAKKYDLYDLAVFQTTVTSTVWDGEREHWRITTDRGDSMRARFVVCANGTLAKPRLARIDGMERFRGHSFHTSRWDYDFTGADLEQPARRSRRHHRHGCERRADHPEPRGEREERARVPADALVDRHPRRLGDRPPSGPPSSSPAGSHDGGRRSSTSCASKPNARRRSAAASPARRRSAGRRTTTSTR